MNVTCRKLIYKTSRRVLPHSLWKNDVVDFLVVTSIDELTGEFGQVKPVHLRYLRADEKLNKNKIKCCENDRFDVSFGTVLSPVLILQPASSAFLFARGCHSGTFRTKARFPLSEFVRATRRSDNKKFGNVISAVYHSKKDGGCRFYH